MAPTPRHTRRHDEAFDADTGLSWAGNTKKCMQLFSQAGGLAGRRFELKNARENSA